MTVIEAIAQWAQANEIEARTAESGDRIAALLTFGGTNLNMWLEGSTSGLFIVSAYLDTEIAAPRLEAVTELTTLINRDLLVGGFQLHSDNRVRFRVGMDLEGVDCNTQALENHIKIAIEMFDLYGGAILEVGLSGISPEEALEASAARAEAAEEGSSGTVAPLPPGSRWIEERAPSVYWDAFGGTGPVRAWAQQLRSPAPTGSMAAAEGIDVRGVFFVGPSSDTCEDVARLAASEANYRFALLGEEALRDLSPTVIAGFERLAPVIVFLKAGPWILSPSAEIIPDADRPKVAAFQQALLARLRAFDSARPVIFCSSTGSLGYVEDQLLRVGAFDCAFEVPEQTPAARGSAFIAMVGNDLCAECFTSSPSKVGKAVAVTLGSKPRIELMALHLRRLAAREQRKVEFVDMIELYTQGLVEPADHVETLSPVRRPVAVHEAGHAAIAILDSGGANIPEFCTIIPSIESRGVVVSSLSHQHDTGKRLTYATFRHNVRCALGGRAAEELIYGPEQIGNGAQSDLHTATRQSYQAFSEWGFAPGMSTSEAARSNLAVLLESATAEDSNYTTALVRRFLADEYASVLTMLRANRTFLEAIAERLMVDPVVDQQELCQICDAHAVAFVPNLS